jgi:hypothetical protein
MNQKAREFKDAMKFWKRKALDAEQRLEKWVANEGTPETSVEQRSATAEQELCLQ